MSVEHDLKCWPQYYDAIERGEKPFDVRRDDRGFQKGDTLLLRRFDPNRANWHQEAFADNYPHCRKLITYILTGGQFGIAPGYVVLGLADVPSQQKAATE